MNLKQLEAFVKVAETKSFSEAAKQLFLTQPTVSAHVSALEKELNTCFLIRNTRGVELSESGKELYAYAVQMLEIEKTIKGRFGKEIKPEGNVLRIGASTVPAQYILPNVMAPIWITFTLHLGMGIMIESGLSFLGVGVQPPTASWGNIINSAQKLMILKNCPWMWLPAGLCLVVFVICINVVGEGLRAALDPKTRI